jgi:phosphate transport system ATP-binding protein
MQSNTVQPDTTRMSDAAQQRASAASATPVEVSAAPTRRVATRGDAKPDASRYRVIEAIRSGGKHDAAVHAELLSLTPQQTIAKIDDFQLWYGKNKAIHHVNMNVQRGKVTSLIGPSGCGKSTLLRSVNRLNDLIEGVRVEGSITINERPVFGKGVDVITLRKRVGMVFQKPNPFPMSIFDNVVYRLRIDGERSKSTLEAACEKALKGAALWDEVKDRLKDSAVGLSGGQQQRLCIARSIVADPEMLLLDEPCSALDPIATLRIEELIHEIAERYTVLIVTHNMQQAARVSDYTAFMYLGRLVEYGPTKRIFQTPQLPETEDYVMGRFG